MASNAPKLRVQVCKGGGWVCGATTPTESHRVTLLERRHQKEFGVESGLKGPLDLFFWSFSRAENQAQRRSIRALYNIHKVDYFQKHLT